MVREGPDRETPNAPLAAAPRAGKAAAFRPWRWTVGGHRQTLLGYWARSGLGWPHAAEDVVLHVERDVRLLLRATWQRGPRAARPALLIVHGLGGSDRSPYVLATGRLAWARGWHVVRANLRGAGDSETLCPRLYNAGLDGDLVAIVDALAATCPRIAALGFSLGGSLALLALGRGGPRLSRALRAVAAVSPPLDLAACADALARPANRLYQRYFMKKLRLSYRRRQRLRPDLYAAGLERGLVTIRDFDEVITAHYGGYRNAADYYARSSAGPLLGRIGRPAFILAAADDPLVPAASVGRWPLSPSVRQEILPTGGHVGFVAPTEAPGFFWAAERVLDELAESLGQSPRAPQC
jgi:hypothetical protein